jgi:archaeosine-15-forming tRNA-guanine transglycosylase
MSMIWMAPRRTFDVPCTVEIEQTSETLHAHVVLDGDIQIKPGDEVMVHNAPTHVAFGERLVVRRTATVFRGGPLDRLRARIEGYLELTELYEVSFSDGRAS